MSASPAVDYAHTNRAEENRKRKASALAATAAGFGLQPYELTVVGGTQAEADRRHRVRVASGLDRDPSVETWQTAIGMLIGRTATLPGARPCTHCDFHVLQVITEAGNRLLIDPLPHPAGTVWPVEDGHKARILAGHDERPEDVPLYRQHATTCPARRSRRRSQAPRCSVCSQPLDAVLAARDASYTSHPRCDPREEVTSP